MGKIEAICINLNKGPKKEINKALLIENFGIQNDFHAQKDSLRQISILTKDIIDNFKIMNKDIKIYNGIFGENLIISGINFLDIETGSFIIVNNEIKIKITIIGKNCPKPCIIQKVTGNCIMPKYGIFGQIIKGGWISNEDSCSYCK